MMTLRVPYIAHETIERDAETLLAEYAHAKGVEIMAPIPMDDIAEKHLKFRVELDDLHRLLGIPRREFINEPDIFGAIWLESRRIVIDESLDPYIRWDREGRYLYTLAHEAGGHGRLHLPLVQGNGGLQPQLRDTRQPTILCRSRQANERVEIQANIYASCLLMPRKLILQAWRDWFGNDHPCMRRGEIVVQCDEERPAGVRFGDQAFENGVLEDFARPFAEQFKVSPVAMRIRLEKLGLLLRNGS